MRYRVGNESINFFRDTTFDGLSYVERKKIVYITYYNVYITS